jgi:hypothetical protein
MCVYVCMCMYVCMYVCVCMYVYMCVCVYVCMYVCLYCNRPLVTAFPVSVTERQLAVCTVLSQG